MRRLGIGTATLVTALGLSACQVSSPAATTFVYDPADGVSLETDTLQVRDLLVVSAEAGGPGVVSGYIVNTGSEEVTVDVQLETEDARTPLTPSLELGPRGTGRLDGNVGTTGEALTIPETPVMPGQMVDVRVTTSTGDVASTRIPVLLPEGPYARYMDLLAPTG